MQKDFSEEHVIERCVTAGSAGAEILKHLWWKCTNTDCLLGIAWRSLFSGTVSMPLRGICNLDGATKDEPGKFSGEQSQWRCSGLFG
jgi:hypothetical protein